MRGVTGWVHGVEAPEVDLGERHPLAHPHGRLRQLGRRGLRRRRARARVCAVERPLSVRRQLGLGLA